MRSNLEKLIAAYEAERASLTIEMEECVAEADYGKAYLFSKGIRQVNQQLQTLYNIQDKWHDEKERLVQWISYLEETKASNELSRHFTELIAENKEKLAALQHASAQKATPGRAVRDALDKLLTGEITGFALVFQESNRLSCHLRLVRRTLILTIPEIRRHKDDCTLEKRHLRKLKQLGFALYDNKDKLMLFAPYSAIDDIKAIQLVLARITFEVFNFKDFVGDTLLKYYP
ncbi:hypothetical protein [Hymenobacter sp. BT559]|uniref:hypothetical protein n=1 Tax=Hymenobacter sp. BT559 TaxID=2795729 RepID=UPI0018EC0C4A|nr:hypothetical protein [Hymenobacter sp. BT559]MBJ6142906.1 hypothetical protein [Hymenobacter sp. BT559]